VTRRRLLRRVAGAATLGALALAGFAPAGLRAARADDRSPRRFTLDDARRDRIERGCRYIAGRQNVDGGFGNASAVVAQTALSILALMANGSSDGRGPYGTEVRKGIDFLLGLVEQARPGRPANEDGYFYYPDDHNSRMHGQGYATLALASALGTSTRDRSRRIRAVLQRAVRCIEQAQTDTGGFGYDPVSNKEHEGSVTVAVAQGLRAARDAGILVNENVVRRGLFYLKRSQRTEPGSDFDGSFRYSLHHEKTSYALTAAALSSFFLYGSYTDDADRTIQRGMRFLMGRRGLDEVMQTHEWWSYGHFYAAWACWQMDGNRWDDAPDAYWGRWHRIVYPRILEGQREDGSWEEQSDRFDLGDLVPTAFAVLTLAIPDEVLPIFQR
jgi:hypothetical protein